MRLEGKVALVTGGGTGIGAAIAERFIAEGAKVCISGRRPEVLEGMVKKLPAGTMAMCPGDTSRDADVKAMIEATVAFGGGIDVLVNNAATNAQGPVADMDRALWRKVLDVNLTGPFMLMQEAIPHMIERGKGSIINISSLGGMRSLPNMPAYCAAKAGLIMLSQQAALDYGRHNIRCNAICPGGIKTDMVQAEWGVLGKTLGMDSESFISMIAAGIPLHRFGEPHEIAGICAFLASDDASFVTGAAIPIDAGTAIVDVVGAFITSALSKGASQ
jgi:meso-butanediol dehydrogenase/(S,S)-butanediol dehydrogenase/diacetyl reductase